MKDEITLMAVGDIMLGDHPIRLGNGVRSTMEKKGPSYLFSKVKDLFHGVDIVFGNLEAVISDIGLDRKKIESAEFRGDPNSAPALKEAGFNVLGFANNHCMEYGLDAFWDTIRMLREHQIFVSGLRSTHEHCIPYEITKGETKAVLLSFSLCCENYHKGGEVPYSLTGKENILKEVETYRNKANFVIVSLHWGEEYMLYPSPEQIIFTHQLVDHGTNLVISHHPHVLQTVERYKGALITYSLGNFVFDMWQANTRRSVILKTVFSREGISNIEFIPIYINDLFQPDPLSGKKKEEFTNHLEYLKSLFTEKYIDQHGNIQISNLGSMEKEYKKIADRKIIRNRLENYFYFLTHFYQYKLDIIKQSFMRSFLRRLGRV